MMEYRGDCRQAQDTFCAYSASLHVLVLSGYLCLTGVQLVVLSLLKGLAAWCPSPYQHDPQPGGIECSLAPLICATSANEGYLQVMEPRVGVLRGAGAH